MHFVVCKHFASEASKYAKLNAVEPDSGEGSSMDWSPEQISVNSPNLIQFDIDL
jgi:hypothetical protein